MKTILCTLLGFNFIKNVQKFPQTLRSWDFYLQKQPFTTHSTMSTRDKLLWKWFNSQMHRHGPKSYQMAVNCIVVTDLLSFVYTKSISPAMLLFLLHFYSASTLEQFFSVLFWLHLSLFDQCFGEGYKKRQQGKKKPRWQKSTCSSYEKKLSTYRNYFKRQQNISVCPDLLEKAVKLSETMNIITPSLSWTRQGCQPMSGSANIKLTPTVACLSCNRDTKNGHSEIHLIQIKYF